MRRHSAGDASRLAALLLPRILPIFSVVAPCQPGASPPSVLRRIYEMSSSLHARKQQFLLVAAVGLLPRLTLLGGTGTVLDAVGGRCHNDRPKENIHAVEDWNGRDCRSHSPDVGCSSSASGACRALNG